MPVSLADIQDVRGWLPGFDYVGSGTARLGELDTKAWVYRWALPLGIRVLQATPVHTHGCLQIGCVTRELPDLRTSKGLPVQDSDFRPLWSSVSGSLVVFRAQAAKIVRAVRCSAAGDLLGFSRELLELRGHQETVDALLDLAGCFRLEAHTRRKHRELDVPGARR